MEICILASITIPRDNDKIYFLAKIVFLNGTYIFAITQIFSKTNIQNSKLKSELCQM